MTELYPVGGSGVKQSLRRRLGPTDLLNDLPVGVSCYDADGYLVYFNRHAAKIWGREPGPGTHRYVVPERLYSPGGEPLPQADLPVASVLRTGKPVRNRQIAFQRPDGVLNTVLVNIEPLYDDDGELTGAVACLHDVTALSRANRELQRTKEDLEDFFENGAVALHVVAGDGTILRANRAELELLGYEASEYIGRQIADFHVDKSVVADIFVRLGRGERVDRRPARMRAKDGSIRHVLITSNAQFRDGDMVGTRCFTYDVTAAKLAEERSREIELRSRTVLEGVPVAIYTTDAEGRINFFNEACVELAGRRPRIGEDRWCISRRLYTPEGAPLSHDQCPMAIALEEQRTVKGVELIVERPDGSRARVLPHPTPLLDEEGCLLGAVNMLVDITERHEADLQLARLAAIVASSDDAIISKSLDGRITSWNAGATRIYGYEEHEAIGRPITIIVPPELHEEEQGILARLRRGERIDHYETERLTRDGRRIHVSLTVSPLRDRYGRIVGASKVSRDITERKRQEEIQQLLLRELDHRVKNTLATVLSIATQTVRSASSPTEFMTSFTGRLQALARTHAMLTSSSWQGTDVENLIRDQILLGGVNDERISFTGPPVVLEPQAALHLGLVLHELGTNARKYGALSVPTGRLSIRWTIRSMIGPRLLLQWQERGGPPVEAPARRGFGSVVISESLTAHGGEVSIEYPVAGVTCEIGLPLSEVTGSAMNGVSFHFQAADSSASGGGAGDARASVRNARVLIVEDEPLVAMDVATALSDAGCNVIGPAATLEKAAAFVEAGGVDAAILDANLAGAPVDSLAAELCRRQVPFAFLTGYGREGVPQDHREAPLLEKPFSSKQLLTTVGQLLRRE